MLNIISHEKIETIIRNYCIPIRIANIPSVSEDTEELERSYVAHGNTKWYNCFGKQFDSFFQK